MSTSAFESLRNFERQKARFIVSPAHLDLASCSAYWSCVNELSAFSAISYKKSLRRRNRAKVCCEYCAIWI